MPVADVPGAALIPDIEVYAVTSLRDLYLHLTRQATIGIQPHVEAESATGPIPTDFHEIIGEEHVKHVLEIAAAGGHNVLTFGTTSRVPLSVPFVLANKTIPDLV